MDDTNSLGPDTGERIERLAREAMELRTAPDGSLVTVVPVGYTLEHLPPIERPLPYVERRESLISTGSFCDYVNRFKRDETQIFGDYRGPAVFASIDYHSPATDGERHKASHCAHAAYFRPPWSEQWERWRKIDGEPLSQGQFAEFIEENYMDIAKPDHADLLDMVANLVAKKNIHFSSGIRLQDGSNELQYGEEVEAKVGKGSIVVPSEIELGLPILFDGVAYKVRVLLRFRINEGRLAFIIKINRRLFVEQTAFEDVLTEVEEKTGITVYRAQV